MPDANSETRRIAILQSCYIPWKGYFDIIGSVDVFVVYDDVQYSKNHWHNRNLIKTPAGPIWLTIPVSRADGAFQPIEKVTISQPFAAKHWRTIKQNYARAPFMAEWGPILEALYAEAAEMTLLTEINLLFMQAISRQLGFDTRFVHSRDLQAGGGQTERLVGICQELGATSYLSGPAAASYIDKSQFDTRGIALDWMDYSDYPEYQQAHGDFTHTVSIIDLLLNMGPQTRACMKAPTRPLGTT